MFYHIGFFFEKGTTAENLVSVQDVLEKVAFDWVRYGNSSWLVYSNATADSLYIPFREIVLGKDQFLILPIDITRHFQGYLSKWIWDWIRIDRSRWGWEAERQKILDTLAPPPPPPRKLADLLAELGGPGRLGLPPPPKKD